MDANGLYDIYDMWHVAWWQLPWVKATAMIIVATAAIGLIAGLIYMVLLRRKKNLPLWQQAMIELHMLQMSTVSNDRELRQRYLDLAAVVKGYLIARFELPAHGLTDEELLNLLSHKVSDPAIIDDLLHLLSLRESISFASGQSSARFDESIQRAMRIIKITIPQEKKS